ncbi:hypothetical protein [Kitasatospora sp. NPDC088351]|uniref:hypothetical protein n=1 Tax=unclassified Kitasatospora TaxID=2633591 RepID=UPI0034165099
MAEIEPTSATTPSADADTPEAAAKTAAEVIAEAAADVAGYTAPADEKHEEPQELFGGEAVEPEHVEAKPGETVPLGAINAHP